jgi:peptidyl-prolyl cis-trans isomerase A (cyclophilin A)
MPEQTLPSLQKGRTLMPVDQLTFARIKLKRTPHGAIKPRTCRLVLGISLACGMLATPVFGQASRLASPATLNEKAPATYKARFDTSKGVVVIDVRRDWAPNGADRFYNLVKNGFYDDTRFFRVINGFMVQFGINGDPKVSANWRTATIKDDPVKQSNRRGYITFATSGPDSRTSQVFINFADNAGLDRQGFSPFGQVSSGMEIVDSLYSGYGEGAPQGRGPDQGRIQREGNNYLMKDFPRLDYIKKATIEN